MKKHTLLLLFALATAALSAQTLPKKYVLVEHFTNSLCSICKSRNPAFYATIKNYPDDVRHLAIHPPLPYVGCVFYQANKTENNARSNHYGIDGTPRVALNGTLIPAGNPLLPEATLQSYLNQTSPVYIEVTESGAAPTKNVSITVHTVGGVPPGNYKLFAAVAERSVNYTSPNGASEHRNVFRAMLPNINGADITLPPTGSSASFDYSYTYTAPNGWTSNFDSLYVLAFIQDADTKAVLNSGTRFDAPFNPVSTGSPHKQPLRLSVLPNPVGAEALVPLPGGERALRVDVFALQGRQVYTSAAVQTGQVRIPAETLAPGIYLVKITGERGIYAGKMVKN